jgi:N-methylhydantoinase A
MNRVAVDVGGTFTDVFVVDDDGDNARVVKVPSTSDPIDGVLAGLREAGLELSTVSFFSHGTTVATNALITRELPKTAMVTTAGFRDVIEIRRGTRDDLWDAYKDVATPYIRRRDRLVIRERVDASGQVLAAPEEDDARKLAEELKERGFASVAVCFMNSYANPVNEQRVRAILEQVLDGVPISISSEILPEIFEHDRFSTTVINAALAPLVGTYGLRLEEALEGAGYEGDLLLLHSGGGVMTPKVASRFAARLAASGIAAGAIAGREVAMRSGYENAIGLDMGGTSTDISVAFEGNLRVTKEWQVEYGYPICFPSIEVLTIGAGGGSVAWLDEAGSLRNGPQSAGARPGPACYGLGGVEPTNTDAQLLLGRLAPALIGGEMSLDVGLARAAINDRIASPLGLAVDEAASAILKVANANMADALRLVSVRRGYDPRDFVLVVFGGAGPLHGADLASELGIPKVLVPPAPGVTSALGCLLVDVRHDLTRMYLANAQEADLGDVNAAFAELEAEGRERLTAEGIDPANMRLTRLIDMRYVGQWRALSVPVDGDLTSLSPLVDAFHKEHKREHTYARPENPVEIYRLTVVAVGVTPKPNFHQQKTTAAEPTPVSTREVWFDGFGGLSTPVFAREALHAGAQLPAPSVVEQVDTTIVVPPGVRAEVDAWLNISMEVPSVQ